MLLDLNFADIPEDTSGPLPIGPMVMKITEANFQPAKSSDKSPSIKLKLMPHVAPGSALETKWINHWISLSPKDYPRQQMKTFFEAVFQQPLNTALQIELADLVGRTVIAELDTEDTNWQKKDKEGNPVGEPKLRTFNKVVGFNPHVMTSSLQ